VASPWRCGRIARPKPRANSRSAASVDFLCGIDEARINGAQQIEFTHAAVAAYVASGMADASFGVEAAARQFGLDFIRMLTEDYFFVCKRAFLETEPMQRVLDIMKGREFQQAVAALPGYVATSTGSVSSVKAFLERMDTPR
jgi:molybdate-binding protein